VLLKIQEDKKAEEEQALKDKKEFKNMLVKEEAVAAKERKAK